MSNSENTPTFFEKASAWVRNSITLRIVTIGILILLLLIPVSMVEGLIQERSWRQQEAEEEISAKWGKPQTLVGPILSVPYEVVSYAFDKDLGKNVEHSRSRRYAHFLPQTLQVEGQVNPNMRYRGIFKAVVYDADISIGGSFLFPDMAALGVDENVLWQEAFLSLGLTDLRGIQESLMVNWDGGQHELEPGLIVQDAIDHGVRAKVPLPDTGSTKAIPFSLDLKLNGSSFLEFSPLGKVTEVDLSGPWGDPKFIGEFLPDDREIADSSFTAWWKVLHLNRAFPQSFLGERNDLSEAAFGVDLILPVNEYQKNERAAKYAVMFITLTFMVFFFIQVLNKVRIHPFQYLLVGLALCIFYTLLLSISEHLPFALAYLIAAAAIIGLVSIYSRFVFKSPRMAILLFLVKTVLYGFIFIIIQLQDYSLLVGSIGLFVALAVVMYLSRKVDWYQSSTNGALAGQDE